MKSGSWMLIAVFFLLSGCVVVAAELPQSALPEVGFAEGWKLDGEIQTYHKDNVFELIDGEAELFFPYGFELVAAANYIYKDNANRSVSVQLYRMGSPLDAFGIYSNFRYPEAEYSGLGAESFSDDYQRMFYQDRYFARLTAYGDPEENRQDMLACAKAVLSKLPENNSRPEPLKWLDVPDAVPHSIRYIPESLLGYAFFPQGIEVEIERGEELFRVFVVTAESAQQAEESVKKYEAYLKDDGAPFEWKEQEKDRFLSGRDPLYKNFLLLPAGKHLIGAVGIPDNSDNILPLLKQVKNRVE